MVRQGVIEWRSGGHRLAYVGALMRYASEAEMQLILVTDGRCLASEEFAVHLQAHVAAEQMVVADGDLRSRTTRFRELFKLRSRVDHLIVPEADSELPVLLLAALCRLAPRRISAIVMRPPRRHTVTGSAKALMVRLCGGLRGIRVLLLEDPLGESVAPVWPTSFRRFGSCLFDPADILASGGAVVPRELRDVEIGQTVVSIVGSVNPRKHVEEVVAAWGRSARVEESPPLLVLAGKHENVAKWSGTKSETGILHIDRYLSDAELWGVIDRSDVILLLQEEAFSSGTLLLAAAGGVPVVAASGTRLGEVVLASKLGVTTGLDPAEISDAIEKALQLVPRRPDRLPNCTDFARTVFAC